jgi:hypothetical protein
MPSEFGFNWGAYALKLAFDTWVFVSSFEGVIFEYERGVYFYIFMFSVFFIPTSILMIKYIYRRRIIKTILNKRREKEEVCYDEQNVE